MSERAVGSRLRSRFTTQEVSDPEPEPREPNPGKAAKKVPRNFRRLFILVRANGAAMSARTPICSCQTDSKKLSGPTKDPGAQCVCPSGKISTSFDDEQTENREKMAYRIYISSIFGFASH